MQDFFARAEKLGKVLDVGAQYCPYYPLFRDNCESYNSTDMVDTPIVDIVSNAEEMAVADCSYDVVLCTQVLARIIREDIASAQSLVRSGL